MGPLRIPYLEVALLHLRFSTHNFLFNLAQKFIVTQFDLQPFVRGSYVYFFFFFLKLATFTFSKVRTMVK